MQSFNYIKVLLQDMDDHLPKGLTVRFGESPQLADLNHGHQAVMRMVEVVEEFELLLLVSVFEFVRY